MSNAAKKLDGQGEERASPLTDPLTHAVLSRALVRVAQLVIGRAIRNSEAAVIAVTEKLGQFSDLDGRQRELLASALNSYSNSSQPVAAGGRSADKRARQTDNPGAQQDSSAMRLSETLRKLSVGEGGAAPDRMADRIMPVITSLQFQDRLRQELEALSASFDNYFECVKMVGRTGPVPEPPAEFWLKAARNFNSMEVRKAVLRCAMGDDYAINEDDIRDAQTGAGDDGFFF